ncbi:MAG: hypothetical protein A2857_04270 [Candidatus Levybacteria bacterium RIFCSPHIGHO2_01_FULL_36_15]|nr:MAG: hypothetical protein A2857_04270 [Candidatus Levybacteria bacterium RIFCSPHIGHO2_01_FULL_36_15]OGH37303.1 MAG: hypothetical protein A2905_03545 [Candidatus Levybacteria bacterium RIFCSPLOWO2_01_FULL_36_10]
MKVIPAILEKEWVEIEKKIELVKPFTDTIHIDIIDGKFAPNTTFLDPAPFAKYTKDIFFEVHLMVDNPISYLRPFADAGFKRFLGHVEKMSDQIEFVAEAELLGEVALALDGKTPIDAIKAPLTDLEMILIMTINAGFSGQKFMPELLEKVKTIRAHSDIPIEVDGGINEKTITSAKKTGASIFSVNSCIFKSASPQATYQLLKSAH